MTDQAQAKKGPSKERTEAPQPEADAPKTRPGFINCPECEKEVKEKNLEVHLRRVHGMTVPEAKAKVKQLFEVKDKDTRGTAFFIILAAIFLAVMIIAIGAYLIVSKNQSEGPSGGPTDHIPITFTTSDGWDLHGDLYNSTGKNPYLILVTGLNEDRSSYKTFIHDMHVRGYGILAYDSRGEGVSKYKNGAFQSTLTGYEVQNSTRDVVAAINALEVRNLTNNGIVLVGASAGANAAAIVGANETLVRDMVLLSPSVDYNGVRPYRSIKVMHGGLLLVAYTGDQLAYESCVEFQGNATYAKPVNFFYNSGSIHGTGALGQADMRSKIEAWIEYNA